MFPHGGLPDWELSLVWLLGVLSHGRFQPGWLGGSAYWCGASCLPGLGWSLWWHSLQPLTMISLSVAGPPKVASSVPPVSQPSHLSLVTASVYMGVSVYVSVYVCVSACVCVSVYVFVYAFVHVCVGGRVGFFWFSSLDFICWFFFSVVVFNLRKALWATFLYEKRHTDKDWFDLIWFNLTVTFQNKTLRFDTSTQISKKRQTQAVLLILRLGTLPAVVSSDREWLCDYHGNSLASRLQLSTVLRRGRLKTQSLGVAGRRSKTGSGRNAGNVSKNSGLSTNASCSWVGSKLDHVLTTNKPYQSLFGTGPRLPLQQGLGPVVLVHIQVRLMCSHLPKRTVPRGKHSSVRFNWTKQGRCENALRPSSSSINSVT